MKKIAIIGPESTGKSTLTQALAQYFDEPYVPEYGRMYLEQNGPKYKQSDLLKIAQGMVREEHREEKNVNQFLFCDTDLIMMKVWYEVKYGECHPYILDQLKQKPYDYYLLCTPDLPWEPDPLRENPDSRQALFDQYQEELEANSLKYSFISGKDQRLKKAIEAVITIEQ